MPLLIWVECQRTLPISFRSNIPTIPRECLHLLDRSYDIAAEFRSELPLDSTCHGKRLNTHSRAQPVHSRMSPADTNRAELHPHRRLHRSAHLLVRTRCSLRSRHGLRDVSLAASYRARRVCGCCDIVPQSPVSCRRGIRWSRRTKPFEQHSSSTANGSKRKGRRRIVSEMRPVRSEGSRTHLHALGQSYTCTLSEISQCRPSGMRSVVVRT